MLTATSTACGRPSCKQRFQRTDQRPIQAPAQAGAFCACSVAGGQALQAAHRGPHPPARSGSPPIRPCGPPSPVGGRPDREPFKIHFHKNYTNARSARKRALFLCSAGPEGEGGGFDSPSLPPLDSLPTRNDQGGALDPKEEGRSGRLAEKALYCASEVLRIAFSGRHPPCAPIVYARPSGAPAPNPANQKKNEYTKSPHKQSKHTLHTSTQSNEKKAKTKK